MTSLTTPCRVRYWRGESSSRSHRDWHTFYALATWTGQRLEEIG